MDRALVGDVEQPCPLIAIEGPHELYIALYLVDNPDFCFAVLAVGRVNPRVAKAYSDALQGPLFAPGIQPDRHGCARPECREQEVVGTWAGIRSADRPRFIAHESVRAYRDLLGESLRISVNQDLAGLGPFGWLRSLLAHCRAPLIGKPTRVDMQFEHDLTATASNGEVKTPPFAYAPLMTSAESRQI
jgi:hypothetical protein